MAGQIAVALKRTRAARFGDAAFSLALPAPVFQKSGNAMKKSDLADLFARRLGFDRSRVTSIFQRATEAGILPSASGAAVPNLSAHEIAVALIAVVADEGLGSVARSVSRYGSMKCAALGETLENAVANMLETPALHLLSTSSLVVFKNSEGPAALITGITVEGPLHSLFVHGDPAQAAGLIKGAQQAVRIDGAALAGIALEVSGVPSEDADRAVSAAQESRWRHATAAAASGFWSREDAAFAFPGRH